MTDDPPSTAVAVATFPETVTDRVRAHRRRIADAGLTRVEVSVPTRLAGLVRFVALVLRDGSPGLRARLIRMLTILLNAYARENQLLLPLTKPRRLAARTLTALETDR